MRLPILITFITMLFGQLVGQQITRGKLTYEITHKKQINYKATDTIAVSGKLFRNESDTTVWDVKVDTVTYYFDTDYIISIDRKHLWEFVGPITIYDFEKKVTTIISSPNNLSQEYRVQSQHPLFDGPWSQQTECGQINYLPSARTFNNAACVKASYTCDMMGHAISVEAEYTDLYSMKLSPFIPTEKTGPCIVQLICNYDDENFSRITMQLVDAEWLQASRLLELKQKYEKIIEEH